MNIVQKKGIRLAGKLTIVRGTGAIGTGQRISVLLAREGSNVLSVDRLETIALKTLKTIKETDGVASNSVSKATVDAAYRVMVETAPI